MSLDASLTDLMDRLVTWSKFPKYQLERRVDIFQNRELRSDERRLRVEAAANSGREERREKVADTRAALASGAPAVFEASFIADGTFAAIDVLERLDRGHALVEVKSTFRVKPQFIPDVAIQVHVARAAGADVRRAEVMHLHRSAGPDGAGPFVRADVTADVEAFLPSIPDQLRRMTKALEGGVPPPVPASSCDVPYPCPFERRCAAERCP